MDHLDPKDRQDIERGIEAREDVGGNALPLSSGHDGHAESAHAPLERRHRVDVHHPPRAPISRVGTLEDRQQ